MSNEDIKSLTQNYIGKLENLVEKSENYLKHKGVPSLSQKLAKIKDIVSKNKKIDENELNVLLEESH